jgi:hypothetical protein
VGSTSKSPITRNAAPLPNRVLKMSIKEQFENTFHRMQQEDGVRLIDWARSEPGEFYKMAAKMIPAAVKHEGDVSIHVVTGVPRRGEVIEADFTVIDNDLEGIA